MKYKLVYLEWGDATSPEDETTWFTIKGAKDWANYVHKNHYNKELGFLLEENKKYIVLASRMSIFEGKGERVGHLMKIPKTWIKKRKILKI